jgi:hypothetical protein
MTEHTGGHYYDGGDGPQPLAMAAGRALEGAAQTAYRAYLDHRPGCQQCAQSTLQCKTAEKLWEAYRTARG